MSALTYVKPEQLVLKNHPELDERWLQDRIAEDPSILGLGDLAVVERERRQMNAGRLDLLLADFDADKRYEVELMLGPTDESHIIRCIEYWDIERRRYPGYDHTAVLVAEDITSRFLNVLGLFAGSIPFVAIQLNALKVGEQVVLDFVRVLDRMPLRVDDTSLGAASPTDRAYWIGRASQQTVELADKLTDIINEHSEEKLKLNYNRHYIGLYDGSRPRTFIYFGPRRQHISVHAAVEDIAGWIKKLEDAGLDATDRTNHIRLALTAKEIEKNRPLISDLLWQAAEQARQ